MSELFTVTKSQFLFSNILRTLFRPNGDSFSFTPKDEGRNHSQAPTLLSLQTKMEANSSREELETPLLTVSSDAMEENFEDDEEIISIGDTGIGDAWYKNPHQIAAMISNFSTSYNVVNISLALPILRRLAHSTPRDEAACASSLLAGMIIGQLSGGALGDTALGRLGALNLVMALQVVASIASAILPIGKGWNIYLSLAVLRFILGVGAGGVYPLAAVLSAEQGKSNQSHGDQVHRVVLTFSTQGLGFVTVPLIAVPLLHISNNLNMIWRVLLGVGSIPGIALMLMQWRLYSRSTRRGNAIPQDEPGDVHEIGDERAPNEDTVEANENDGIVVESDSAGQRIGWWEAIRHEPGLGRKVIGTAGTWCLFDILFYGNALFQPVVIEAAFGSPEGETPIHVLQKTALNSLILTCIALPGYAVAGLLIGKRPCCFTQTPRYVMLQGFAAMSILYMTIGSNWRFLGHYPVALVILYGLTFFFANYGPNTTTFILPSLLFSPECRSTWNGVSAASGKLGALLGATFFAPVAQQIGSGNVMILCSILAVVSFVITWCFVPTENEEFEQPEPLQAIADQDDRLEREPSFEAA